MSDIAKDLISDYEREARPEGADAYRHDDVRIRAADEIRSMRRVIARLRLTDAEREAVEDGVRCCEYMAAYKPMDSRADLVASAATLRRLLERMK